jgi:hypothetical protein
MIRHMDLITANDNDNVIIAEQTSVSRELMKSVFAVPGGPLLGRRRTCAVDSIRDGATRMPRSSSVDFKHFI